VSLERDNVYHGVTQIRVVIFFVSGQLLEENIRKVKLSTPDYRDMDPEQAVADFRQRREMYMRVYEPVDMSDGPHIKIVNSRQFIGTVNMIGFEGWQE
jgi:6-phosphofructo-2-kinase / fructose-2,6-biphosphatase 4